MKRGLIVGLLILFPQILLAATDVAQPESVMMPVLKMLGALGVVVGLILVFYAASRRGFGFMPKARSGQIEMLETRALGGKKYLSLVKVRDQELLLGISNEGITCLSRFPAPTADFSNTLDQVDLEKVPGRGRP